LSIHALNSVRHLKERPHEIARSRENAGKGL
jgi:hypothetical protein